MRTLRMPFNLIPGWRDGPRKWQSPKAAPLVTPLERMWKESQTVMRVKHQADIKVWLADPYLP